MALTWLVLEGGSWLLLRYLGPADARALETVDLAVEPELPEEPDASIFRSTMLHPFLGYVRDPNQVLRGFDPRWSQFGFLQRGPIFQELSPDHVVVGVLGGSVAQWLSIQGFVLRDALAAQERFFGRRVDVVVMAAGAFRQPQQLIALDYFLALGARFDVVLNVDGFNDFVLTYEGFRPEGRYPFYPQGWEERVAAFDLAERRRIGKISYLRQRREEVAARFAAPPWRYSSFVYLLGRAVDVRFQRQVQRALADDAEARVAESRSAGRDFQALGPDSGLRDKQELAPKLVSVWQESSRLLHQRCRARGIEYHHFLQPNQYVEDSKVLSGEELRIAYRPDHPHRGVIAIGYPLMRSAGEELRADGVSFHDLSWIFRDRHDTLYRDTCCHLNDAGNEGLAQAVAERVGRYAG